MFSVIYTHSEKKKVSGAHKSIVGRGRFNYSFLQILGCLVDDNSFSLFLPCQGHEQKLFFCQDDEDDEGYFGNGRLDNFFSDLC